MRRLIYSYLLISSVNFLNCGISRATKVDNECSCLRNNEVLDCRKTYFTLVEGSNFIVPDDSKIKSWSQAKAHCESFGAQFAEIANYKDSYFLRNYIEDNPATYWIGVIQRGQGKFTYADGTTPITFSPIVSSTRHGECVYVTTRFENSTTDLMYGIADCHQQRQSLCQYSRGTRCYKTEDLEGLRDSFLPNSGLYISLEQKSWAEADYDCRRHDMHLLTEVIDVDETLDLLLSKMTSEVFWREIWTGGKFISSKYNTLRWSATNEIMEIDKSMNELWDPSEPREKSGSNLDLCLLLKMFSNSDELSWSVENCNLPKYYICKEGLHPALDESPSKLGRTLNANSVSHSSPSKIEYCDNGMRITNTVQRCSKSTVMCTKQPDCICFEGVHGVTDHNSCTPQLLIGKGCHQKVGNGTQDSHWKMLNNFDPSSGPFVIIQTRNPNSGNYIEWSKMSVGSKRQLFGPTTIFYSGIKLFKKWKKTYCTEAGATTGVRKLMTTEHNAQISFSLQCKGSKTELPGEDAQTTPRNECQLSCAANSNSGDATDNHNGNLFNNPSNTSSIGTENGTGSTDTDSSTEKEKQNTLGLAMIKTAIDNAFDDNPNKTNSNSIPRPSRSFRILDKLFQITKQVCVEGVPSDFLYKGLSLFKTLHAGKDYGYDEYFTEEETVKIEWILNKCMVEEEEALVQINNCTGQALYYEVHFPNGTYFMYPVQHKPVPQHHVPELTWNVVDLTNVACLRSFRSSYLLYHKLEQGMENLFTNEIRKLWHHPVINAESYKKILGANELTHLINLRACADAVYKRHNRVTPLERPKEPINTETKPSGGTISGQSDNIYTMCTPKSQCKVHEKGN